MSGNRPSSSLLWTIIWALLFVLGSCGWWVQLSSGQTSAAYRALLIAMLFFTPLAAGLVTWAAVVMVANGRWAGALERPTWSGLAFAPFSIVAIALLWLGRGHWAPWGAGHFHQGLWLDETFLFGRNLAALVIFWALAAAFVAKRRAGRSPKALGALLIAAYCVTFSLMGFDFVMALDPEWFSSLFGGYFFISGMYTGVAAWALLAATRNRDRESTPDRLHDLGKLIVTFSIMTTYMMYSQLLAIWYGNLPGEVRYIIPRMNTMQWPVVSAALVGIVYLGPLALLLPRAAKRSRTWLGLVAALLLTGMYAERWWLVTPTLAGEAAVFGWSDVSAAAAMLGLLGLGVGSSLRRLPTNEWKMEAGE